MTAEGPLRHAITAEIKAHGPISVAAFMDRALNDAEHGYYRTRAAIGAGGDFITAPEISQVFGELVGLWSAVVWQTMGAGPRVRLVEIGPGRGTLMADALRAVAKVSPFADALDVHLVETNRALRALQEERLCDFGRRVAIRWHESLAEIRDHVPSIVIANEFLDTCPARQIVRRGDGWVERGVGIGDGGEFVFVEAPHLGTYALDAGPADARPGDIFEIQDFSVIDALSPVAADAPFAALLFDYGHMRSAAGDTLQAVRHHKPEPPLLSPGDADLTVHVDFEAFAARARTAGFSIDGPLPQGEFLGRLGIVERASRLMSQNPRTASEIELQIGRILSPAGMGSRFKAIGLRAGLASTLPGF